MDLKELKAKAYDTIGVIQQLQTQLAQINKEIANFKEPENKPVEGKKK